MNKPLLSPADKSNANEKLIVFGFLVLYLILCTIWHFRTNAPWDDDCIGRYFNARLAMSDPKQFIDLWNRPLFILLFFIPFQLGKHAILFMSVITTLNAYALYLVAKELKISNAYLVVPMLLFQAFFFTISSSALAEPLAATLISFSYLAYVRKKFMWFALLGGLLPLARLELSVILSIWAYVLFVNKQWKYMILLVVPCIIWSLAGTIIDGDLFWLYKQTGGKDNSTNIYGHTTFGHYFQRYIYVIGPFLFYFFFIGLAERLYKRKFEVFPISLFALGFMVYVVFSWKLNLGQAAGFLRHMAVISPLAAIIALYGYNYWIDSFTVSKSLTAAPPPPAKTNVGEGKTLQQRINEIQKKGEREGLKSKQIRHQINAEKAKAEQAKTSVIKAKQKQQSHYNETKNTKYRILIYSALMLTLAFIFFSTKLSGHHKISDIKDYTNVLTISGLSILFIILLIISPEGSMVKPVKFGIAFIVIACITGYTLITEPPDSHDSPERKTMEEVSNLYTNSYLNSYQTYVNHAYFFWANDLDQHANKFNLITQDNLNKAPDSSIVIWENHYSSRLAGNVDLNFILQKPDYIELFRKLSTDNKFSAIVFQKIKHPDPQGSLKIYDRLIAAIPNLPSAYFNRGNVEFNAMRNYDEAIKDYNKAIKIDTNNIDAYYNCGAAYLNLKKYAEAAENYGKAIQLKPDYDIAYYNRAVAYSNINEPNKAIADYSKAIELKSGNSQAYYNRGLISIQLGQGQNGCKDLQKALELGYQQAKYSLDQYCK